MNMPKPKTKTKTTKSIKIASARKRPVAKKTVRPPPKKRLPVAKAPKRQKRGAGKAKEAAWHSAVAVQKEFIGRRVEKLFRDEGSRGVAMVPFGGEVTGRGFPAPRALPPPPAPTPPNT